MYVELPEAGSEVEKGNNFGVVESVKVLNRVWPYPHMLPAVCFPDWSRIALQSLTPEVSQALSKQSL